MMSYTMEKEEVFSVRYDETDLHLAAGLSTGRIAIHNLELQPTSLKYKEKYKISEYPVTCVRWKPKNKTTLLVISAEGLITQVHSASGKVLQKIEETGNPLLCADYSCDGNYFATGGNDRAVKLYDDNTKTLVTKLEEHKISLPLHSNRIFAVKFSPTDPNLLLSGGWDSNILLYDIRAKEVQNYAYGPHICGDGLDIKDNLLLAVSWTKEDQIQLFDIRNLKSKGVFQMTLDGTDNRKLDNVSYLYSCRFSPKNKTFCVTGSKQNYFRVYDYTNLEGEIDMTKPKLKTEFELRSLSSPCYCCDYNSKGSTIAYGCSENKVLFVNLP